MSRRSQEQNKPERPPVSGAGSGVAAWRAYAAAVTDSPLESWAALSREDIIATLDVEGVGAGQPAELTESEREADRNAAAARAELAAGGDVPDGVEVTLGEQGAETIEAAEGTTVLGTVEEFAGEVLPDGPLPDADPAGYPDDAEELPAVPARRALTADSRPKCYVDDCPLPEFADDIGLCGGHWSNRPDLRKVARHD